jgi:hypothetical protein
VKSGIRPLTWTQSFTVVRVRSPVELSERWSDEPHHVDLGAPALQVVHQRLDESTWILVTIEGPVREVHPEDAERLLFMGGLLVEEVHVDENVRRFVARVGLEPDTEPPLAMFRCE